MSASLRVHRYFDNAHFPLNRLDLHLHGPAVRLVLHVEGSQCRPPDHAERAEIGNALPPKQRNQYAGYPVSDDLRQRERASLPMTQDAGTDYEVGPLADRVHQARGLPHVEGLIAIDEQHQVDVLERGDRGQAGDAVARRRLADNAGAGHSGALRGGIDRPVVAHHNVVDQGLSTRGRQRAQVVHDHGDVVLLVARRDDRTDSEIVDRHVLPSVLRAALRLDLRS